MPIEMFAFSNYNSVFLAIGKDGVFLLVPNWRFLLSNLGPHAKIKLI